MKNPERQLFESIDRNLGLEKLYRRTEEFLEENPPIDPDTFRDLYGDANVDKDIAYVRRMEEKFEKDDTPEERERKKLATAFEAIIAAQIGLSNWMGPEADTITPSRFDDIANGVDVITELKGPEQSASHLALAVDVTFGRDVSAKIERILGEIRSGQLTRIKYFESEFLNFRGEKSSIPRVVIGADREAIEELGKLWVARDHEALARHEMQTVLLEEIVAQLGSFARYAAKRRRPEVAATYERTSDTIQSIIRQKERIPLDRLADDGVMRAIKREVEQL